VECKKKDMEMLEYASYLKDRHNEGEQAVVGLKLLVEKHEADNRKMKILLLDIASNSHDSADPEKKRKMYAKYTIEQI